MNLPGTRLRLAAVALVPLLALTACGSGSPAGTTAAGAAPSPAPTDDPVAAVHTVGSIAALLPAEVRKTGTLRVGEAVGSPPSAYYPGGSDKKPVGQDIDITERWAHAAFGHCGEGDDRCGRRRRPSGPDPLSHDAGQACWPRRSW
ncbi:hypothetical protein [Actinacidiphila oryziradicis]|uniref:hypothetical protein n=1 Tax=Actinacidiphila oryziradicis TaxID=2571141 RepID=UPI001B807243|nr:hypothetical protein [Actinacidiphila oryziradicis]